MPPPGAGRAPVLSPYSHTPSFCPRASIYFGINEALRCLHAVGFICGGPGGHGGAPPGLSRGGGVPLKAVLTPQLHAALCGSQQAGQGGVEGDGLHHSAPHGQRQRQGALWGGGEEIRGVGGGGDVGQTEVCVSGGGALTSTRSQK